MRHSFLLIFVLLIQLIGYNNALAQSISESDSTERLQNSQNESVNTHDEVDDDFVPGLFIFVLIVFVLVLMAIGAGMVITVLSLLVIFGLLSFGIISTSVLLGLHKKSISKGFQAFVLLCSCAGCFIISVFAFFIFNLYLHWFATSTAIIIGGVAGIVGGIGIGLSSIWLLKMLTKAFKERFGLV